MEWSQDGFIVDEDALLECTEITSKTIQLKIKKENKATVKVENEEPLRNEIKKEEDTQLDKENSGKS